MRTIAWLTISLVWIGACGHTGAGTAEEQGSSRSPPERTSELAQPQGLDEPAEPVPVHDPARPVPPVVAHDAGHGACGHTGAAPAEDQGSSGSWPERAAERARRHGLDEPADPVPVHDPACPAPPVVAHDEPGDCLEGWTCPVHGDALERSGALDGLKIPMKQSAFAYRCRSGAHVWVRTHGRLNVGRILSQWYGPWPLGG